MAESKVTEPPFKKNPYILLVSFSKQEFAEVKIEFGRVENIKSIWVMTSTFNSSPQYIEISAVVSYNSSIVTENFILTNFIFHSYEKMLVSMSRLYPALNSLT